MGRLSRQRQSRGYTATILDAIWKRDAEGRYLPFGPITAETDTYTCLHCEEIIDKPPFMSSTDEAIGAWCSVCNGTICRKPKCKRFHDIVSIEAERLGLSIA